MLLHRAAYRVRQFGRALLAMLRGPDAQDLEQARKVLPPSGWQLFRAMPRADQMHALNVWRSIRKAGWNHLALSQAALLHDVAKHEGGVTLLHRVAVVLIKAFAPGSWQRLKSWPEPSRRDYRYPLWAHANHPRGSAMLAESVGCLAEAVDLIRRHQEPLRSAPPYAAADDLLGALQAADDDN